MLQPVLSQGLVYVHLRGHPLLDGGGCGSSYVVGRMDDQNFKAFVFSTLLAAKGADSEVVLRVSGCYLGHPLIEGVEYSPRQ